MIDQALSPTAQGTLRKARTATVGPDATVRAHAQASPERERFRQARRSAGAFTRKRVRLVLGQLFKQR